MERQTYRFNTAANAAAFAARLEREYRIASVTVIQRVGRVVHVTSAAHVWPNEFGRALQQIAAVEQTGRVVEAR